jgi:hypothetical protein
MPTASFNSPNTGANRMSPKSQHAVYFSSPQPTYSIRMPPTVDLTIKEYLKDKVVEENDLEKLATLEERIRAIEGNNLYDPIKAVQI